LSWVWRILPPGGVHANYLERKDDTAFFPVTHTENDHNPGNCHTARNIKFEKIHEIGIQQMGFLPGCQFDKKCLFFPCTPLKPFIDRNSFWVRRIKKKPLAAHPHKKFYR
jgi:hypothetical protein